MTDTERSQRTTELMTRYGTDIKRFCLLQLRDASQAEAAANTCRDYQRTGWFRFMDRRVPPEDMERGTAFGFPDDSVSKAITELPALLRQAVTLRYFEELADQALLEKYGITEEMQPGLIHSVIEKDGRTVVTYEVVESTVMRENRFGTYIVTVVDGQADAVWSMDGMDTTGGLDAPAWGAEQLLRHVREYATVMSYMETRGMLQNAPMVTPAPAGIPDKWEQNTQTALSMGKISLEDAVAIGRDAVIVRYGLTEQQAAMLVRFDGSDPEATVMNPPTRSWMVARW